MVFNVIGKEEPNIDELKRQGLNPVDLHCHTEHSDSNAQVNDLIKKAAKLGVGLGITDHNEVKGALRAFRNKQNVLVVPGIELTSYEAKDFLFYFYDVKELDEFHRKYVRNYKIKNFGFNINKLRWTTEELLDLAGDYNCVVGLPHPFALKPKNSFVLMNKRKHLLKKVDLLEVFNGQQTQKANNKAWAWNRHLKKPFSAGSDCHTLFEMGRAVTAAAGDDVENFLKNVLKKKNKVVGCGLRWYERIIANGVLIKNNITLGR